MNWQTGDITLQFPRPTLVMGIVNVTPDSFSDGGKFFDEGIAVQRGGGYIQPLLRGLRKACFLAPCAATAQMLGETACLMSKRALKPLGLAQTAILVVLET